MYPDYNNPQQTPPPYYGQSAVKTQTNSVMKRVYVRMFIGLLVSAFCALGVASSPAALNFVFGNAIMRWGILIAMFAMAILIPVRMLKMSSSTVLALFLVYSALMGTWLSAIFVVYKMTAIVATFFITAGTFGAMSVYGYVTKTDLTKMGSFLMMALFGLVIAMLVNLFLHSSTMSYVISIIGVLIFTGLTAWDTQQVKQLAAANLDPALADKLATMGAMNLYLDFVNLFLFILRIFGGNRD
ncbi:MAG: Bax inhibitor-1/YccA family protein [Muribaculaceae bacterium]|nr:Bax inhibitor-1/YccA family protein [Muribaculaceae bacterium]MDE6057880.1 Bax inhibitor-1/YccA family protein [Muribaculaceae bacterium]MDE6194989.1 Bax inhibitor-1/YccA family protein [Muribaculaceae bacterium]